MILNKRLELSVLSECLLLTYSHWEIDVGTGLTTDLKNSSYISQNVEFISFVSNFPTSKSRKEEEK